MKKTTFVSQAGLGWVVVLGVAGLAGCGGGASGTKKSTDNGGPTAQGNQLPIELVKSDIVHLRGTNHDGPATYDAMSDGSFTKVFGGTSPAALARYLDDRLSYFVEARNLTDGVSPRSVFNQTWLGGGSFVNEGGAKVGASNVGTLYWLAGLTANIQVTYTTRGGQSIPVNSSRTGIMMIGEGYTAAETSGSRSIPLPPEYRQMILVHEARHSDCTGGMSQTDIATLRGMNSWEVDTFVRTNHCGHLHMKCPSGHPFAGLAACDSEGWGAYSVGEVFYRGIRQDSNMNSAGNELNRQIADIVIIDMASRTPGGRTGSPDMSSAGAI